MMTQKQIIHKILNSKNEKELFGDLNNWRAIYKAFISEVHPDICKEEDCEEATRILNQYKQELENGKIHKDDAGEVTYLFNTIKIKGDKDLLKLSYDNYDKLMSLKDEASQHFKKYLPDSMILNDDELIIELAFRSIPLSSLGIVEQKHVNWILSRMIEFTGWLNQVGFCHAGINPDSIYAIPENHGMVCISFYHLVPINTKLNSISGRYVNFYPSNTIFDKKASRNIDLDLAKRTAIYLLGDTSGVGTKLRNSHNEELIDFYCKNQESTIESYDEYRSLLKKHFDTKQFHVFNV